MAKIVKWHTVWTGFMWFGIFGGTQQTGTTPVSAKPHTGFRVSQGLRVKGPSLNPEPQAANFKP